MKADRIRHLSYVTCSIATLFCIYLWIQDRSVFLDEANLILNIHQLSFVELLGELKADQRAPFLFTWLAKFITLLCGDSTMSFRFLPLVLVVSSIWIFNNIAIKNYSNFIGLTISVLFSTNDLVLRYATECKQYGGDLFSTVLLIYLWQKWTPSKNNIFKWILLGSLLMWMSMPVILMLVGIGLSWSITSYKKNFKNIKPILYIGVGWIISLGINYFFILSPGMQSEFMQNYHAPYFLDLTDIESIERSFIVFIRLIAKKTALGMVTISLLIIIGIVTLVKNNYYKAIVLLLPIILTFIFSSLEKYSLLERLVLFTFPILLILAGEGIVQLLNITKSIYLRWMVTIFIGITLVITMKYRNGLKWIQDTPRDNIKPVLLSIYKIDRSPHIHLSKHAYPSYNHYVNIDKYIDGGNYARGSRESNIVNEFEPINIDSTWILLSHVLDIESETKKITKRYKIINDIRAKGTVALQVVR